MISGENRSTKIRVRHKGERGLRRMLTVYRATLAELIDALAKAERQGQLAEKIRFYARASLLIVDEIG